jgi:hypothetical protein
MKPSAKSPAINNFLKQTFGVDREAAINSDYCVLCKNPATEFKDAISQREFTISGMCQPCQDKVFK